MDSFGPMESKFLQGSIRTPHVRYESAAVRDMFTHTYLPYLHMHLASFPLLILASYPPCRVADCVSPLLFACCAWPFFLFLLYLPSFSSLIYTLRVSGNTAIAGNLLRHLTTSSVVSDVRLSTLTIKVCVELFYMSSPSPLKDHGMTGSTDFRGQNVGEARGK